MAVSAKRMQTNGNISRHAAPARLLVALYKICNKGPGAAEMMDSASPPETNSKTMRKMKPVTVPIQTQ